MSGGDLDGQACVQWWTGAELIWNVWGDTYVPYSYQISTAVLAYDQCTGFPWVTQMTANDTVYYNTYSATYVGQGEYQDCTSGHAYRVYYAGARWAGASSDQEGAGAYVYW